MNLQERKKKIPEEFKKLAEILVKMDLLQPH